MTYAEIVEETAKEEVYRQFEEGMLMQSPDLPPIVAKFSQPTYENVQRGSTGIIQQGNYLGSNVTSAEAKKEEVYRQFEEGMSMQSPDLPLIAAKFSQPAYDNVQRGSAGIIQQGNYLGSNVASAEAKK